MWYEDKLENNYSTPDCWESNEPTYSFEFRKSPCILRDRRMQWNSPAWRIKGGAMTRWHFSDSHLFPEPHLDLPKNGCKAACGLLCHSGGFVWNCHEDSANSVSTSMCTSICMCAPHSHSVLPLCGSSVPKFYQNAQKHLTLILGINAPNLSTKLDSKKKQFNQLYIFSVFGTLLSYLHFCSICSAQGFGSHTSLRLRLHSGHISLNEVELYSLISRFLPFSPSSPLWEV